MKLHLLCTVIFVFLLSICFFSIESVDHITTQTESTLQEAVELYRTGNYKAGSDAIMQTYDFWENKSKMLNMLLYHEQIDDITVQLIKLNVRASEVNLEEIFTGCAELSALLDQIREMEHPYLENIL